MKIQTNIMILIIITKINIMMIIMIMIMDILMTIRTIIKTNIMKIKLIEMKVINLNIMNMIEKQTGNMIKVKIKITDLHRNMVFENVQQLRNINSLIVMIVEFGDMLLLIVN